MGLTQPGWLETCRVANDNRGLLILQLSEAGFADTATTPVLCWGLNPGPLTC